MNMQKIEINTEWLYHQICPLTLKKIYTDGFIYSMTKQGKKKPITEKSYNGNDYISLAKKIPDCEGYSCYLRFISSNYALILENLNSIKPIVTNDVFDYYAHLSYLNCFKRHSCFNDEYMVRDEISKDKVVGIKIPDANYEAASIPTFYSLKDTSKGIDEILSVYNNLNLDIPFIDVPNNISLSNEEVKEYILSRKKRDY
jgi:hypothetical protein